MKKEAIIGLILIFAGVGLYAYYNQYIKPEDDAREYLVEGKMVFERGNNEAVNNSIDIFAKVIAKYPKTKAATESYYYIGRSYEKLGLNRLAYLKYIYILKTSKNINSVLNGEIRNRMARLKIMKRYTEEGIHQLLGLLNYSTNRDFRSRVYTELGHTYLKMGSYKKAKRMFDIAITENGSNEEALLGKARAYKRMGYDDMAYNLYEYFLKYYGNFSHFSKDISRSYINQVYQSGYANFKRGKYSRAISFFKRLLRIFPKVKKSENALYWLGESYFALKKYETAILYFNRVLSNYYYHKDQDARIKKGYTYFSSKRFDLAAREFHVYISNYPKGRHIETAKKWKEMSTKEILYRIQNRMLPDDVEGEEEDEEMENNNEKDNKSTNRRNSNGASKSVQTNYRIEINDDDIEYENVAEL